MADNAPSPDAPRPAGGAAPPMTTLLLTRPRAQAEAFAARFAGQDGLRIVIAPLMEIVALAHDAGLGPGEAAIFTSGNAVALAPAGGGRDAWCVGTATAAAAEARGYVVRAALADAAALGAHLRAARPAERLVHLHGRHLRRDLVAELQAAGLRARGVALYDQRACDPGPEFHDALAARTLLVPLFSPRSARFFAEAAGAPGAGAAALALSAAVRDALPGDWQRLCTVAAMPDADAMAAEVARRISH